MPSRLVITNADAGGSDTDAVDAAVAVLSGDGPVEVEASRGADDLDRILAGYTPSSPPRVVVAAGGDGSLHALVSALHHRNELDSTVVGLVPLGTGNDFARGVGLSLDAEEAARQHLNGTEQRVDILVDDADSVVVNAVHIGVGADAAREAEAYKSRMGKLGYVMGAVKAGVTSPGLRLQVRVDREELAERGKVLQLAIGNGAYVGGGTPLVPSARHGDGQVDVVVSYADAPLARLAYGLRLRRGTHVERRDVVSARGAAVTVRGDEFWCNADGEVSGPRRSATWWVRPGALRIVLPSR